MTNHPYVRATWVDSGMNRTNGWESLQDTLAGIGDKQLAPVITVGVLMHEDDNQVVIGQSYDSGNDTWYSAQVIWKKALLSLEPLMVVTLPEPREDEDS